MAYELADRLVVDLPFAHGFYHLDQDLVDLVGQWYLLAVRAEQ